MLAKCVGRTKNVGELLSRVHLHCEAEGWVGWYIMHKVEKGTMRSWIKRYLSLVGEGRVSEADALIAGEYVAVHSSEEEPGKGKGGKEKGSKKGRKQGGSQGEKPKRLTRDEIALENIRKRKRGARD